MSKVLVVTSGKGGVGKTTTTAALGAALAQRGEKVVVVDFDVGLRNLDLVMGAERRVVFDLINVVQGVAKLPQALIKDKRLENLWLLPASQTRDKDALTEEGVGKVIADLRGRFDWVICDSPAGIERGASMAMRFADEAVIVTNPEVSSVRDSDRIIGMLDSKTVRAEKGERVEKHILITRYDPSRAARGEMLTIDDILEILATPLLGIIPESQDVLKASNVGTPVTLSNADGAPARAYIDAARRLCGDTVPMQVPAERKGFMDRLLRRRAACAWVCFGFSAATRPLHPSLANGCRSCLPMNAECVASPICSVCCVKKFSPSSPSTSRWIRPRSSSGSSAATRCRPWRSISKCPTTSSARKWRSRRARPTSSNLGW